MMRGSMIAGYVVIDFIFGLLLVCPYAAIWLTAGTMDALMVVSGLYT